MKSTGIVRKLDELGRVVLPIELRKNLDMNPGDSMEIFTEGETIILRKYTPCCVFCGESNKMSVFKSKNVCEDCIQEIAKNK